MKNFKWIVSKITRVSDLSRYIIELPAYLRGTAKAKLPWGGSMWVPFPEHRAVVETGIMAREEECINYFLQHIQPGDIFFDIGANAGYYSLLAAYKGAYVLAFEPFPTTYKLLQKNIAQGGNQIIATIEAAVSDFNGILKMQGSGVSGYNHISPQADGTSVRAIALDSTDIYFSIPKFIKIDAEGHDLEALKGMEHMLRLHHPTLIVECDTSMDFLLGLGYKATLLGAASKRDYLFTYEE